jgi:hypothetical protein
MRKTRLNGEGAGQEKGQKSKRKESAKVSRQEYSQDDDDNVLETRAEVREYINSFQDAEETPRGKRKLGGQNLVSVVYNTRMVFFTSQHSNLTLHKPIGTRF